jgi:MinD-like ATPase involved in chromosome partitioning or flagellar assembly
VAANVYQCRSLPRRAHEFDLYNRIRRTACDAYQIGVIGLKGGVGRTTVTAALGSVFSATRGDRIPAIDVDPNGGNLVDRTARRSAATIEHLLGDTQLVRYNDIRAFNPDERCRFGGAGRAGVQGARQEFSDDAWRAVTRIVAPYYNLVLADAGTGLHNPAAVRRRRRCPVW